MVRGEKKGDKRATAVVHLVTVVCLEGTALGKAPGVLLLLSLTLFWTTEGRRIGKWFVSHVMKQKKRA